MKKSILKYGIKAIILCQLVFTSNCLNAQINVWTWIKGSNLSVSNKVLGTKGVAAPTNTSGGIYDFASWTDKDGNFGIFGGQGYTTSGSSRQYTNNLGK